MPPDLKLIFSTLCIAAAGSLAAEDSPIRDSRQCLLVIAENWQAQTAALYAFERDDTASQWRQRGAKIPVVVGKSGLAWGRGTADVSTLRGPVKAEGDGKAPAGVFPILSAFGYATASEARDIKLPYLSLTPDSEGVDDPRSRFYNQLVERSKIPQPDWRTSEHMRRRDDLYRWGALIGHNTSPAQPGAGSCIFLHIWRNPTSGTAGCTAMEQKHLTSLLTWLDPKATPLLVQLPREFVTPLREKWSLPQPSSP